MVAFNGIIQAVEIGQDKPGFIGGKASIPSLPLSNDSPLTEAFCFGDTDLIKEDLGAWGKSESRQGASGVIGGLNQG